MTSLTAPGNGPSAGSSAANSSDGRRSSSSGSSNDAAVREITVQPHRVFINHVDGYHASKLIDVLLDTTFEPPEFEKAVAEEAEDNEGEETPKDEPTQEYENEAAVKKGSATTTLDYSGEAPRKYDLIGTVKDRKIKNVDGVRIIPAVCKNQDAFMNEILRCGFVVFDIAQEPSQIEAVIWTLNGILMYLEAFESAKPRAFAANRDHRYFILISNVMTWGRTKPSGEALTEAHYRKRKAHPDYRQQIQCERAVFAAMKKRPQLGDKLRTVVVCSGVSYGEGEDLLQYAFKLGWLNETRLPVLDRGDNLVPMIHVRDLAAAVFTVMREWPRLRYVLAVEKKSSTQRNIIKAISKALTTGRIKSVGKDEALQFPEMTLRSVHAMSVNLSLHPAFLTRSSYMRWRSEKSFVENIQRVVQEFRESRSLRPVRLVILGPPASGKSQIARELARHYRLHYVGLKKLISDTIQKLSSLIMERKEMEHDLEEAEAGNEEIEEYGDADESFEYGTSLEQMLNEITTELAENNGLLSDSSLTKLLRFKLLSKECQNQGYVLDGYPKTIEQAIMLFTSESVGDEEDERDMTEAKDEELMAILPDFVIAFDASDEFLMSRIADLAERDVHHSRYSESNMITRLARYRERNTEDNGPLQLFDELEIHPVILNVEEEEDSPEMIFRCCLGLIGETHNYGKTPEEVEAEKRRAGEIKAAEDAKMAEEQARVNVEIQRLKEKRAEQWASLYEQLAAEEEERANLMAEPLRRYLMKHVLPLITRGLVEVSKLRPEDPLDYLAEYLIRENPEGRPFEPDFNEVASSVLSAVELLQCEGALPALGALGDEAYEHLRASTATFDPTSSSTLTVDCECSVSSGRGDSCKEGEGESSLHNFTCSHPSQTCVTPQCSQAGVEADAPQGPEADNAGVEVSDPRETEAGIEAQVTEL